MEKKKYTGKVVTVLGPISPRELGMTLCHEHLISNGSFLVKEPNNQTEKEMVNHPVTIDILWWLNFHHADNIDDLKLLDEEEAIEEVLHFKTLGGNSIVELSSVGLSRDPEALARISTKTGLNIIMGSGYYTEAS